MVSLKIKLFNFLKSFKVTFSRRRLYLRTNYVEGDKTTVNHLDPRFFEIYYKTQISERISNKKNIWRNGGICLNEFELGCFSNDDGLEHLKYHAIPDKIEEIQTSFRLYDNTNISKWESIDPVNPVLFKRVPKNIQIIFIIHGFLMGPDSNNMQLIKNALYERLKNKVKIIMVDWVFGAIHPLRYEGISSLNISDQF